MPRLLTAAGLLLGGVCSVQVWAAPVDWLPLASADAERVADTVFGGTMVVYEAGPSDAETVVLVHGIGGAGARDWRSLMIDLAADHHVIALDLPGFGESSKGNNLYAPEQLAVALHAALTGRGKQPFTLLGYSLGAAVSLAYANLYPDDLSRLLLADMPGVLHQDVYTRFLSNQGANWLDALVPDSGALVGSLMSALLQSLQANGVNPGMLLYSAQARARWLAGDPSAIAAFAAAEHDFSAALRDVRVPTVVLWGEDDAVAPLRTGQLLAGVIPGARLQILPGVGHMLIFREPELFNAAVRAQLSGRLAALPAYATPARKPAAGAPSAGCDNRAGMHFSGELHAILLSNCRDAVIDGANVDRIEINGGNVRIVNSNVFKGIESSNANVEITAGSVRGDTPLLLDASNVDAAGTRFISEYDIANNRGATPVTLSMSVVTHEDPDGHLRSLHEIAQLPAQAVWP